MARIRTIKPEFWTDEKIGSVSIPARLLLIGSLNFADDHGGLDRSAKQLKAQVFPYDAIDCEPLVLELIGAGLVIEYQVADGKYLHIKGFQKHQKVDHPSKFPKTPEYLGPENPRESSSITPEDSGESKNAQGGLASARDQSLSSHSHKGVIGEGNLKSSARKNAPYVSRGAEPEWFLDFKLVYPNRAGDQNWSEARRRVNARVKEGHTPQEMIGGAQRYAAYCKATESVDTQYVKQASVFLGTEKHFLKPWDIPPGKAERRLNQNLDVAAQFLAGGSK